MNEAKNRSGTAIRKTEGEQDKDKNDAWGDKLEKKYKEEILIGCANVGRLWIRPVNKGKKKKENKKKKEKR